MTIVQISQTERACVAADGSNEIMKVEQRFGAALPTVRRASRDGVGGLILDGGGIAIVLVPAT